MTSKQRAWLNGLLIAALVAGMLVLFWQVSLAIDQLDPVNPKFEVGQTQQGYIPRNEAERQSLEEFEYSNQDSQAIIRTIAACYNADDWNAVAGISRTWLGITGTVPGTDIMATKPSQFRLNGLDMSVLHLNENVKVDRWKSYRNFLTAQSNAREWQALIIILGALATLFVAIKATKDADGWVGYVALFLTGASAAATSWNAFNSPAALAASSQQRLATLQGIHQRLSQIVERSYTSPLCPSPKAPPLIPIPGEPLPKTPSDWTRAYVRALEEVTNLRAEYVATLQVRGAAQGSEGGQPKTK